MEVDNIIIEQTIVSDCDIGLDLRGMNIAFENNYIKIESARGKTINTTLKGKAINKD